MVVTGTNSREPSTLKATPADALGLFTNAVLLKARLGVSPLKRTEARVVVMLVLPSLTRNCAAVATRKPSDKRKLIPAAACVLVLSIANKSAPI